MWPFARNCEKHGHKFVQRFERIPHPKMTKEQINACSRLSSHKIIWIDHYARDICVYCGDAVERANNDHPLQQLARCAK